MEEKYGHWEPAETQRVGARLIGGFGSLSSRWATEEPEGRFVIRKTRSGKFYFALEGVHGELVASSPDFDTKHRCLKAAAAMKTIILVTTTSDSTDAR